MPEIRTVWPGFLTKLHLPVEKHGEIQKIAFSLLNAELSA